MSDLLFFFMNNLDVYNYGGFKAGKWVVINATSVDLLCQCAVYLVIIKEYVFLSGRKSVRSHISVNR
jgi:hypothetical protein